MEHLLLSDSSARCKEGATTGAAMPEDSDERTQEDLHPSSDPDMFALVSSILEEPEEPEAMIEGDSESNAFSPNWSTDLENNNRYSSLFPINIWDHESQANFNESQASNEENLEGASSIELLSSEFSGLQVTGSMPLPCPPCHPPSQEGLQPFHLQNENFTCEGLNQHSNIAPEYSNSMEEADVVKDVQFPEQVWNKGYEQPQEGIAASNAFGTSSTEQPIQLSRAAVSGIWQPAVQANQWSANSCTYKPPQYFYFPAPVFNQGNSIPQRPNMEFHLNQQQNFSTYPGNPFNHVNNVNSAYPLQRAPNYVPPPPGFQKQDLFYGGHKISTGLNPPGAPGLIYQNPNQMPWVSPVNRPVAQGFGSQMAPPNGSCPVNYGFFNTRGNPMASNSARYAQFDLPAPQPQHLGAIPKNIPPRVCPQDFPTYRFPKFYNMDSAANGAYYDQEGWQGKELVSVSPAFAGPAWIQPNALNGKTRMGNFFDFVNSSFLQPFPVNTECSQNPNHPSSPIMYYMLPPLMPEDKMAADCARATNLLYTRIEECHHQLRALERQRAKIEADLAISFPLKSFSTSRKTPRYRLRSNPSRVDRLIWSQYQEHAKVTVLIEKMEQLFAVFIHENTWINLNHHLEVIRMTHARRHHEIYSAARAWKLGVIYTNQEKDTLALASAVKELMFSTQKTRTVLWCALQHVVFPKKWTNFRGQYGFGLPRENRPRQKKRTR